MKTPVIAVTANAVAGEKNKCIDAGMDDFLTKPFKKGDLFPVINKWLLRDEEVAELEELEIADDSEEFDEIIVDDPKISDLGISEEADEIFRGNRQGCL